MIDFSGKLASILAIFLNATDQFLPALNNILVIIISLLAIIYWTLKIRSQLLETQRQKNLKK